jgi:hypothetical protein
MMEGVNLKHIVSTFVNVTMYPQYNIMIKKKNKTAIRTLDKLTSVEST